MHSVHLTGLVVILSACTQWPARAADTQDVDALWKIAEVDGGLVVHLGCADATRTCALRRDERFLVHGLDTDQQIVDEARKHIHEAGLYGPIAVDQFNGTNLPYVDDTVNLMVVERAWQMSVDELMRVLAPRGQALIAAQAGVQGLGKVSPEALVDLDGWVRLRKPVSPQVDQWTHFLHDASGNAVAGDQQVGSPTRLRWLAGPRWCRSHEMPSSVGAVVTANGRIFTILDEGPSGVFEKLPAACKLVARDAANGVLLWKVPLQQWQEEDGTGRGSRWNIHHTIPRRLIAFDDRVYVTLSFAGSPVSVLDAASGRTLQTLEGTVGADELLLSDGVLVVKCAEPRSVGATIRMRRTDLNDTLVAVDAETGQPLWRKEDVRVMPYVLAAEGGRVVYHDMSALISLDIRSGDELWRVPYDVGSPLGGETNLLIAEDVVLFHGMPAVGKRTATGAEKKKKGGKNASKRILVAYSLDNGKQLWQAPGARPWSAACTQPTDVFFASDLVWCGDSLEGRDLHTGEVKKTVAVHELISPGHHFRCHRAKATENYLILPKRGAEFVDLDGSQHMRNDWLRAPCFTGATPANGLMYIPPSQCFCYPGVKVSGYLAMSAAEPPTLTPSGVELLERGAAYASSTPLDPSDGDWPMYRRDVQRSGSIPIRLKPKMSRVWEQQLASVATQPVVVGDRLWVAEKDTHRVRCLDARSGQSLWQFTAGGRVDSSPTIYGGYVLFGCCDGFVYCLRASDGVLAWRFRAAPGPERLVSYEQLESLWPVHGSVLVQDGTAYFAAGRSSFLDGGIVAYALDVVTGQVKGHHLLEGPWPDITEEVGTPFAMEGALPDLFVSDGTDLFMQRIKFDAELNRLPTRQLSPLGELDMGSDHLVPTGGFLDDTGFDRVYWMHSPLWPGFYFAQHAPKAGQLVVFDDTATFAVKYFYQRYQWSPRFVPADAGYLLFADDIDNQPDLAKDNKDMGLRWLPEESYTSQYRRGGRGSEKGTGYIRRKPSRWQQFIPVRVRAMAVSDDFLLVVGPPDIVDSQDPLAALEGRQGSWLQIYSKQDGSLVDSVQLGESPVFDGLSLAHDRVYLATQDGKVICFGG